MAGLDAAHVGCRRVKDRIRRIVSFWSRGAQSHFAGCEGALALDGAVRTTMVGADYARGPLVVGLSLAHSRGLGGYDGVSAGRAASAVTGLYPWQGYQASERVSVWGVVGYGAGGLLLTLAGGPALEVGLRHDGGDAEQGSGIDIGGGLVVFDPSTGLSANVRVRMLLVHEAEGFSERGVSVLVSWNPTPSTPLGFVARVAPSWGGHAASGAQALWGRETMADMAHGGFAQGGRLDGEVGYGLPVGSRFVGMPRVGFTTSEHGRDTGSATASACCTGTDCTSSSASTRDSGRARSSGAAAQAGGPISRYSGAPACADRATRSSPAVSQHDSLVNELPSVALTQRFLALCEAHGSQRLAVRLVAVGRATGVPGLPPGDDWTAWDTYEMRAVVEYLEQLRVR